MPRKRAVDVRIDEAKDRLQRLQDEKRLQELRDRMKSRQPRSTKRRRKTT